MFRDMTASTVIMMLLYFVIGSISDVIPICWNSVIYLVITYIIVNSATRSRGKRFVNNVIVCDICDKNK